MAGAKLLPSQEELKRLFIYNPDTGELCWRISPAPQILAGSVATVPCANGYLRVQWQGRTLKVHRIAWKYMTGDDPFTVDHINRITTDNRWCNLREATHSEQNYNRYIKRNTEEDFAANLDAAINGMDRSKKGLPSQALPSRERLCELFSYDPETGLLTHKTTSINRKRKIGDVVTCVTKGHLKTCVDGKERYVHRIAWKMMTGKDAIEVDHINRDGLDNRWCNLREAERHQNMGNIGLSARNKSGVKGVYWAKDKRKWTAQISINDKIRYLGRYDRIEDAKAAYEQAALKHFGFGSVNEEVVAA